MLKRLAPAALIFPLLGSDNPVSPIAPSHAALHNQNLYTLLHTLPPLQPPQRRQASSDLPQVCLPVIEGEKLTGEYVYVTRDAAGDLIAKDCPPGMPRQAPDPLDMPAEGPEAPHSLLDNSTPPAPHPAPQADTQQKTPEEWLTPAQPFSLDDLRPAQPDEDNLTPTPKPPHALEPTPAKPLYPWLDPTRQRNVQAPTHTNTEATPTLA